MSSLSQYFVGVAMKRLVSGELPFDRSKGRTSTQHEFNSTKKMVELFGTERIESKPANYIYLSDKEDDNLLESGSFSFYDSREKTPHRTAEYRFYYNSKNSILDRANEGDLLFIGKSINGSEVFIIAERNSTVEQQLIFLFGIEAEDQFQIRDLSKEVANISFIQKYILDAIGVELKDSQDDFLDEMVDKFKGGFPSTAVFSQFARSKVMDVNPIEDPDDTIVRWYEMEYLLFKTLERYIVGQKLESGFGKDGKDVDDFLKYSLSVHQRRKSRAGDAFENHLAEIFTCHNLKFTPQARLGKAKPDFIFPSKSDYENEDFQIELLTMLGAKTSAKERWKQLIPESKISPKHFITLEPAISKNQTDDMIEKKIQLILPASIITSYSKEQQRDIIEFRNFIDLVKERQRLSEINF